MININNKYVDCYNAGFDYFLYQGKYKEALNQYKRAIKLKPEDLNSYYDIGFIYATLGKIKYAIRYFNKCLKISRLNSEKQEIKSTIKLLEKGKSII